MGKRVEIPSCDALGLGPLLSYASAHSACVTGL